MKKEKLNKDTIIPYLIDKMLDGKSTFEEVLANPSIDGVDWYTYYTWTEQEMLSYKKFFIDTLVKNCVPKFTKVMAEREWTMFNLMWGLKLEKTET